MKMLNIGNDFSIVIFMLAYCSISVAYFKSPLCRMKTLDLKNSDAYMYSTAPGNEAKHAFDHDYARSPHSLWDGHDLDDGDEWFLVHFNVQKIQLLQYVSIVAVRDHFWRLADFEIFLADKISKNLHNVNGKVAIPWNEFIFCGKTPANVGESTVEVTCKKVYNTHYIAMRRKFDNNKYCCINFAEMLVNVLDLYEDAPMLDHTDFNEGSNHTISIGCSVPESAGLKTQWFEHNLLNDEQRQLSQVGGQIHLNNVQRQSPKKYKYVYVDISNNLPFYTSEFSSVVQVRYAAANFKINPDGVITVQEDHLIDVNCTSDAGYPYPRVLLHLDNMTSHSVLGDKDVFGGYSAHARSLLTAQLNMHEKSVTCTLIQAGFPNITKHVVLHVKDKKEGIVYHRSLPSSLRKILSPTEESYMVNLTKYISSAVPNEFNITCAKNEQIFFGLLNKPLIDLHIQLNLPGNYQCYIDHKTAKKILRVNLFKAMNKQNSTNN